MLERAADNDLEGNFRRHWLLPSTYDFSALVIVISNDAPLAQDWKNRSQQTFAALEQFRKNFKPGIVKSGHPFIMNDFLKAHEVYDTNWDPWNGHQLDFFAVFVIGYLERMLTAPYLQASCQGLRNIINNDQVSYQAMKHSSEVMNYVVNKKVNVLPLDSDPSCRLGLHFVVDSYYGRAAWRAGLGGCRVLRGLGVHAARWKTMSSKHNEAFKTYAHAACANTQLYDCVK